MICGAIFDIDGVLLDSMTIWRDLGSRYLKRHNIQPKDGLDKILFSMSMEQGAEYLKNEYCNNFDAEDILDEIKDMLKEGDVLTLYIKDEFFEESEQENYEFLKAPDKLDIVYEDENIILIDKKPGIIVHQDKSYHFDSLVARVQHYLYNKGEYNPKEEKAFAPALANRIDRNTGGIVIAAKNAESLRVLNAKIKTRELEKYYLCLLHGKPKKDCDILHDYLIKNEAQNKVKVFSKQVDGSKEIITKYEILDFNGKYSLAEVELLTGRTHQIRAHMAYIGHPLVGDTKYGKNRKAPDNIKYQALYSYKLKFSFDTDAGILNYLNGKEFSVKEVWFAKNKHISI